MPSPRRSTLAVTAAVAALSLFGPRVAAACGGCFHPPTENPTVVTDHRMICAVSPQATTLYDQMRYDGSPSSFAWVLPIADKVTVGLSSDELFEVLDTMTQVEIIGPDTRCNQPACMPVAVAAAAAPEGAPGGGGVKVLASEVVGPYETVQLKAEDPRALATWLAAHKYEVPPASQSIIDAYVKEKFAFLAMKLVPGASVKAMRPVRVTSPGASMTLPLRMVAAGAGPVLGVTLWVTAQGRYEPQNFPSFTISAAELAWDWSKETSDYTTVRAAKTASSKGSAWLIESSLDLATHTLGATLEEAAQRPHGNAPPVPDFTMTTGANAGKGIEAGATKSAEQLRHDDLAVLLGGDPANVSTVRVTRMRADLAHSALSQDLHLQAAADQSLLSNIIRVTRELHPMQCPVYDDQCKMIGNLPRDEANAKNAALPPYTPYTGTGGEGGGKKWCAASAPSRSDPQGEAVIVVAVLGGAFARRAARRRRRRG
jgi:Uncharacterized protein conserved in bacteria (DUF2330)